MPPSNPAINESDKRHGRNPKDGLLSRRCESCGDEYQPYRSHQLACSRGCVRRLKEDPEGTRPMDARKHALYRFWSDDGDLLYIGITVAPGQRFRTHLKDQPWWDEVGAITIQRVPTYREALLAEAFAIRTEHPKYNVMHNKGSDRQPRQRNLLPQSPPIAETLTQAEEEAAWAAAEELGIDLRRRPWPASV